MAHPDAKVIEDLNISRVIRGWKPKYLHYNVWPQLLDDNLNPFPTISEWSETAPPLPSPPASEFEDLEAVNTIKSYSHLFKIVTPIKVDVLQSKLRTHPNQPLVDSICHGLREGFWPFANTRQPDFPCTHDASQRPTTDPVKSQFLHDQVQDEIKKGCFLVSFGKDLLPGMFSTPVYAVPKPHSSNLRMVTDHSAGSFPLNHMINKPLIKGVPLDNLSHLGQILLIYRKLFPDCKLILFKCDIAEAFRLLPMHPLWQLKQINTCNGERHVDRNATFGSSASPMTFVSTNSTVEWVAKNVEDIWYFYFLQ
jgi:hypothetical protein